MQIETRERIHTENSVAKEIERSPPQSLPSAELFSIQEVVEVVSSAINLSSQKAAGQDLLKYEHLKNNLNSIKTVPKKISNTCFVNKKIPKHWKEVLKC